MKEIIFGLLGLTLLYASATLAAVNVNSATVEELIALPGVGEAKAQAIIKYREIHGDFKGVNELNEVPGIGEATIEELRDEVTVNKTAVDKITVDE